MRLTSKRKAALVCAGMIMANDLLWLTPVDIFAACKIVSIASFLMWAAGLGTVVVPYACAQTREGAWGVTLVVAAVAYLVAVAGTCLWDSPEFAPCGNVAHIAEVLSMTWSLTGALGIAACALFAQMRWYRRELTPEEIPYAVRPFAPDPAFLVARSGLSQAAE